MLSTVLLCPPDYYQIEYEINPWMHVENRVDYAAVREEFEQLVSIYKKLGLEVIILPAQPGLPDMVYTANCGFVIDDIFIKANFRYPQRRKEAYFAEELFKKLDVAGPAESAEVGHDFFVHLPNSPHSPRSAGLEALKAVGVLKKHDLPADSFPPVNKFKIQKLPDGIFFEGQGDMFYRDGKFFCGYGKRTAREAIPYIEKIVGQKAITIEVNDPYYYHLDTCFAPIGKGIAVIKPSSFSPEDVRKIKKNFRKVIEVGEADNPFYCCNAVAVGDVLVVGRGVSSNFRKTMEKEGFQVIETPMSEFLKGGGAVKCCTLEFFDSRG